MIKTAEEFKLLRTSNVKECYDRAASDSADDEVWLEVIQRFPEMREWVAHNKTVSLGVLKILSEDMNPKVRAMVASKRKLDFDLFQKLSTDKSEAVRQRIAYNKKVPKEILMKMQSDTSEIVREVAKKRYSELFKSQ